LLRNFMNCGKNGVDIIDAKGLAYNFFRFVN
ncbi:MAG: MltA-interacting MipA family protein, partial [Halomonas sp. 54_146]